MMRVPSRLIVIVTALLLTIGVGGLGYYLRSAEAVLEREDRILSNLTLYVTVRDAIASEHTDELRPILVAGLESDFYRMVQHWQQHGPAQSRDLQCSIAKRIRKMRADGELFDDERRVTDSGIDIDIVNRYLATQCLGAPRRTNWISAEDG